jgi:hypothetical protein
MAQCHYCQNEVAPDATRCPQCNGDLTAPAASAEPAWGQPGPQPALPGQQAPPPGGQQWQQQAGAAAQHAQAAARDMWVKVQAAGPSRVGVGLMAGSAIFYAWSSQRGIWNASWRELIVALLVLVYLGMREFGGNDVLQQRWWAPLAASAYLLLWGITGLQLKLGSLLFIAGAGLLAWAYFWPLREWAASLGLNWRYGLYGFRRPVMLGAIIAFLSLFLTWIPDQSTWGYWSGGYDYAGNWDSIHWYNPGYFFPAWKGMQLNWAVPMQLALLACLAYAMLAPQFAVPKWYRHIPLIGAGFGLLFVLKAGAIHWGGLLCLVGLGLIAWGGYQLGIKGVAEGSGDLREIPLNQWLSRWL